MKVVARAEPHPLYERLFIRAAFALVLLATTPRQLNVQLLPQPNGLARLVDLSFLTNSSALTACHYLVLIALGFYVTGILLWLALPVLLLINVAINSILNSQGAIGHSTQIVSLVLLAQTAAYCYGSWRRTRFGESAAATDERAIWWSQQTIAATYFVAGLTKLIETNGTWVFRARFVGVDIVKTTYQEYYNRLDPAGLDWRLGIAQFAAAHGVVAAALAAVGLFLELFAPLMLLNRWWGLALGCAFLVFHNCLDQVMALQFLFNQLLVLIFMVGPIFWIAQVIRATKLALCRFRSVDD
jgi:hypothetical protein